MVRIRRRKRILMFGDKPGAASVGLLYLCSYLRRFNLDAKCCFFNNEPTLDSLLAFIIKRLRKYRPDVVGVSLNWFTHLSRGLDICRFVKMVEKDVRIVVGGNTASHYYREIIKYPFIDAVIIGDGELPLLQYCKGNHQNKNIVTKARAKTLQPFMNRKQFYVEENDNTHDVYLRDLSTILAGFSGCRYKLFIPTGKGCSYNCFYCAGNRCNQRTYYGRTKYFYRPPYLVNNDLKELRRCREFNGVIFDGDLPPDPADQYFKECMADIDFKEYTLQTFLWKLMPLNLVKLFSERFAYVDICIDIALLSEEFRNELYARNLLKPVASNEDIIALIKQARTYRNVRFRIEYITDYLPGGKLGRRVMRFDKRKEQRFLKQIACLKNTCTSGAAKYHVQPGTVLLNDQHRRLMTFPECLYVSSLNNGSVYARSLECGDMHFPYPELLEEIRTQ